MSEQDNGQVTTPQRPTTNDGESWKAYWRTKGQKWRTKPEISQGRKTYLAKCLSIEPDFKHEKYPFKNVRLNRADIEWLVGQEVTNLILIEADLSGEDLRDLSLERVRLDKAHLEKALLVETHLEKVSLTRAHLEEANLVRAHLEDADLEGTHFEQAYLGETHLEGASLIEAHLEGSDLSGAFFDANTYLDNVILGSEESGFASVVGVHWGGVDLSVIDWTPVKKLGDEVKAFQPNFSDGSYVDQKSSSVRLMDYQAAVRANRQLSLVLRDQGLTEEANYFAYRAQKLQRVTLRFQRKFRRYFFSLFLDMLAGYGYKPGRSFVAYLIVITAFATAYFIIGHTAGPALSPLGAWVFSMTSFHGRGFFPGGIGLDDPLTVVAAIEAFVGLLIEVTFIATLTQRLFGK